MSEELTEYERDTVRGWRTYASGSRDIGARIAIKQAATIERLEGEVERLRGALIRIYQSGYDAHVEIAREALNDPSEKNEGVT